MQNIYGQPGESIERMNQGRFTKLHEIDRQYHKILREIHNWEVWIAWERETAKILENLAMEDPRYTIIHDVQFDGGNIDHIVIYEDRIVIIIETKASASIYNENKVVYQVTSQWNCLRKRLWIQYIKSFVCLSRSDKELHERKEGIEITDPVSLKEEIKACIRYQTNHLHNKEHPWDKKLVRKVLAMKWYH